MSGTITTPIILEGFEAGRNPTAGTVVGSLVTTITGNAAPYATNPAGAGAGGAYSLRCNPAAATSSLRWTPNTAYSIIVCRFAVKFTTMTGSPTILTLAQNTNANTVIQYISASSQLRVQCASANPQNATVPADDTWHVVDLLVNLSANPNYVDWAVDGVAQTRSSTAVAADTTWQWTWGFVAAITADMQFDDLVVTTTDTDYPIGNGYIKGVLLDGTVGTHNLVDGTTMAWSTDGTNFTNISSTTDTAPATVLDDNVPPWPASTFPNSRIRQNTANASYVDLNLGNISDTPRAVGAQVLYGAATATANTGSTWFVDDGGNAKEIYGTPSTPRDHSEITAFVRGCPSYITTTTVPALTPASGAWDATKFNACKVRMGASNDISPVPYWFGVLIQYEFVPAAPVPFVPRKRSRMPQLAR